MARDVTTLTLRAEVRWWFRLVKWPLLVAMTLANKRIRRRLGCYVLGKALRVYVVRG